MTGTFFRRRIIAAAISLFTATAIWTATPAWSAETESERLFDFMEEVFQEAVARSPEFQTFLGDKSNYDKWDDRSDARAIEDNEITKENLARLYDEFDFDALDEAGKLNYRLLEHGAKEQLEGFKFRFHFYPVNQMFGTQTELPSFLIDQHRVDDVKDAESYIARLRDIEGVMAQVIEGLKVRQAKGVVPPKFVFPKVLQNSRSVVSGAPFDASGEDSSLLADFKKKVNALELDEADNDRLIALARMALVESVAPAYAALIGFMEAQEEIATTDDGVWKLPDGDAYYDSQLKDWTTTDLTADEIHQTGLDGVARIQVEIEKIMKATGFEGTLQEFFVFMREDPQFYYPNTDEGRDAYLANLNSTIDEARGRIGEYFLEEPKLDLLVKRVEPFREQSSPGAFYLRPPLDGSRPGIYYINLYNMADQAIWDQATTAYHEALPGHHMQNDAQRRLEKVPTLRKIMSFGAHSEGWGLYAERLAKEMGLYEGRPYKDFGRLSAEL